MEEKRGEKEYGKPGGVSRASRYILPSKLLVRDLCPRSSSLRAAAFGKEDR